MRWSKRIHGRRVGFALFEMTAAHGHVAVVSADFDLGAFPQRLPLEIGAQDHGGFAAAMTDGFDLDQIICPAEEGGAAFEQVTLKIGAQAVAEHGNIEFVGGLGQLEDLVAGEKLRFVDQHAGERLMGVRGFDLSEEVILSRKTDGFGGKADTRADPSGAATGVDAGSEEQGGHAPFLVVVARLEEEGGFACVHRRVIKVHLGHTG